MSRILLFIGSWLISLSLVAQQPDWEQAKRFVNRKWAAIAGTLEVKPHFYGDRGQFWYVFRRADGQHYYFVDPRKGKKEEFWQPDTLARQLEELTGQSVTADKLSLIGLQPQREAVGFTFRGQAFRYDLRTKRCLKEETIRKASRRPARLYGKYSPDSTYVAYVKAHDLYLLRVKDSVEFRLTHDGERYFSYGERNDAADTGRMMPRAKWFGDSKKLYVIREDWRRVGEMPLVSIFGRRPSVVPNRQPLAGDKEVPQFEASVFDVASRQQVRVKMDKWKDQLLWLVHAGQSSDCLYIQRKRRTREELEICAVDTETGDVRVVIRERNEPYLNDELYAVAFPGDSGDILWWSERTGYGHYYLYDHQGRLKRQLTTGEWTAGRIVRIDTARRLLYFEGHGQQSGRNPYYARLNRVSLDGGKVTTLTPEEGQHRVTFSPDGNYFVDVWSRPDRAPESVLRDTRGRLICRLERAELDSVYAQGWRMPECFTVKAADSVTNLYGVMWKPVNFDSTRHYPLISYVYPGPYTEYIPLEFSLTSVCGGMELAQLGFVVVCFGNRGGSPLRGRDYHCFGYGNLRDYPLADNKYGLEQLLARHDWLDASRVGIYGHSGGGAMTVAALCTYPGFYRAGVASSGNHDNHLFEYGWSEIHHGIRETVRNGETTFAFDIPTNIELASRLQDHLMLITGDMDNTVHPSNTLRMASALINAGKDFELVVLPGQKHGFMGPAQKFYRRKLWGHFARYLWE